MPPKKKRSGAARPHSANLVHIPRRRSASPPDIDDLPHLPPAVRELVLDRIEAGFRMGLFRLDCESYGGLLDCLMPDEFTAPPPPKPTETPPRSEARIEEYVRRCRRGVALFHAADPAGDQERKGMRPEWTGGSDPWTDDWLSEGASTG